PLQRHGPAGRIAEELFQLIPPMRRNRRVGVEGKPIDTGAARPREPGRLTLVTKSGDDAPEVLPGPVSDGDGRLDRGGTGTGELRGSVAQRIIAGGHGSLYACVQIAQPAELPDDPSADLLDHLCYLGIAGWLDLDEARLEAGLGAIHIDALKEDEVEMEIGVRHGLHLMV